MLGFGICWGIEAGYWGLGMSLCISTSLQANYKLQPLPYRSAFVAIRTRLQSYVSSVNEVAS
jgi:hypothetical protein